MNSHSNHSDSNHPPRRAAFTLVELMAILVAVGVIGCLLVAAALRNSGQIKRAQCASNLRQFNLAMQIYGNEYGGRLPSFSPPGGFWIWDLSVAASSFVESTGTKWAVMYCPGTSPRFTEADNFQLYNWGPNFRVIGYAHTFPGSSSLTSSNVNESLTPGPVEIAPFFSRTPLPSERVLLADATISDYGQNSQAQQFNPAYNYNAIAGGFAKPHLSPHLSGRFPMGGNVGMLDGHVAWRRFKDMRIRTTGGAPGFWW